MNNPLKILGSQLVEDASCNEEFSAQRGLINELFPYVYEASKRMSSRAISRWLEANGTKLSAATIAKALRNPEPYWQELFEEIEPAARIVARAHEMDLESLLENRDLLLNLESQTPFIEGVSQEGRHHFFDEYQTALSTLKDEWFSLPHTTIEACLSSIDFDDVKSTVTKQDVKKK